MCGRFTQILADAELARVMGLDPAEMPMRRPRYNIAPTQRFAAVRLDASKRVCVMLRWGLIPSWAKDIGNNLINARGETVASKPAFRSAFKRQRCLVPGDGFYEWKATGEKYKQPFFLRRQDEEPFVFAGLWECWNDPAGATIESGTIITTTPNAVVRPIHDRMPVVLNPGAFDSWLDPKTSSELLLPLLRPYDGEMVATPVGRFVTNPRNEGVECLAP